MSKTKSRKLFKDFRASRPDLRFRNPEENDAIVRNFVRQDLTDRGIKQKARRQQDKNLNRDLRSFLG